MTPAETVIGSLVRVESSDSSGVTEAAGVVGADEGEETLRPADVEL
jgi:hypothetical protein